MEDRGLDAVDASELQNQDLGNVTIPSDAESDAFLSDLTDEEFLCIRWPGITQETVALVTRIIDQETRRSGSQ